MKYLLSFILIISIIYFVTREDGYEGFNQNSGRYCYTCAGKTYNQCVNCFNCGWCVDKWGNGSCIGSTAAGGPMNNEVCGLLYQTDPFTSMVHNNRNYKCSNGPLAANRRIGIDPSDRIQYDMDPLTMPGVQVHNNVASIV